MAIPVFSNTHLISEIGKLEQFQSTLRNIVFLNCGGKLDLTKFWFYQQQAENQITAFLLDSHRPFNHNNVIDFDSRLFVIDDGCKSFVECPTNEDAQVYQELG